MYQLPEIPTRKKPKAPYRKPEAVRELEEALYLADCRKHPSIDGKYIARRKMRDDTSGGLTACIVAYAKLNGSFASRLNNTGIFRNGRYTRSTARRGLPDVLITAPDGRSIFVEVKVGRDRMSEHQERVQQEQQQAGGIYLTIRTFAQFYDWYNEHYVVRTAPQKSSQVTERQYTNNNNVL